MIYIAYTAVMLSLIGSSVYFFSNGQNWLGALFLVMVLLPSVKQASGNDEKPATMEDAVQVVADSITIQKAKLWDKLAEVVDESGSITISKGHHPLPFRATVVPGVGEVFRRDDYTVEGVVIKAHYKMTEEDAKQQ